MRSETTGFRFAQSNPDHPQTQTEIHERTGDCMWLAFINDKLPLSHYTLRSELRMPWPTLQTLPSLRRLSCYFSQQMDHHQGSVGHGKSQKAMCLS